MPCSCSSSLQRRAAAVTVALLITCGFIGLSEGELTLTALPDVLFINNSGVHGVELGTVLRARCTTSNSGSDSPPLVTWFKNGNTLLNDPPHVRIRSRTNGTVVSSVLTIDNFGGITDYDDDGEYYCQTSNDTHSLSSSTLTLSVVNDSSIYLFRNPVDYEIVGGAGGILKTYDVIRDNRTVFTIGQNFEESRYTGSCCQVLRCIASLPGDQTSATNISQLTLTWLKDEQVIENSTSRIQLEIDLRYQPIPNETRFVTNLRYVPFDGSDTGVYQCVYSDYDSGAELLYSTPFRLDSVNGTDIVLEAVSPSNIVLNPPKKLVIEVDSFGGYYRHAWFKNNVEIFPNDDTTFRQSNPAKFSEFFQVYVQAPTSTSDHGIYRVDLVDSSAAAYKSVEFAVTPSVSLSVEALNTTTITIVEGDSVNVSCIAKANPLPSIITWSMNASSTSFSQTDSTVDITAYLETDDSFSFTEGNRTSTLHIIDAIYPTHSGIYTCSSSNDTSSANATITIEIQVPPEVSVLATRTVVPTGQSTTLTCTVSRTQPTNYTIQWILTNTTGVSTTLNATGETLLLTDITEAEFGNYTCNVSNSADLSGSSSITIEQGVAITVSIEDVEVAVVGNDIILNCTASGGGEGSDLVYQWTMANSTNVINSDNATGLLSLTAITETDFGTYVCTVSDAFDSNNASITLQQAAIPTVVSGDMNVSVVEGETLELMATFEFNLDLQSITWEREGEVLASGVDRVIITNTTLQSPNATATLTRTGINRDSDGGEYTATATNQIGSATAIFNVDIYFPPEVNVSATFTRLPVNGSTIVTCDVAASNPPEVTFVWTFTQTTGVTTVSLNVTNSTLELSRIQMEQFGTYTCNATNSIGLSGYANVTIEKGDTPQVSTTPVDPAIPGDNVTLNCMATGDGPLVYQWTMLGDTTVLNSDNTTGVLMLLNIHETQFGTYMCTVRNDLGTASSEVTLERAVAPTAGNNRSVTFSVGEDLVLMAQFADYNLQLNSIEWTQNSTIPLTHGINGTTIANTNLSPPNANSTLIRSNITGISYGGQYTATASNRAGSNSTTFTADIISEPEILTEPDVYEFNESSTIELECRARGIPPVEISWIFEEMNFINFTTNSFVIVDDVYETTSVLSIDEVRRSNGGTYVCVANNGVPPSDFISINVTVNFAPIVTQQPTDQEVLAPDPVTLTCSLDGEPLPDITWLKQDPINGTIIEYQESMDDGEVTIGSIMSTGSMSTTTTSTIRLNTTDAFDAADYFCRGENFLGSEVTQPATVTVYVSPMFEEDEEDILAIESQLLELTCSAVGVPPPNITFMRGDTVLDGSGTGSGINTRVRLRNHTEPVLNEDRLYEVNRSLEIVNPLRNDTGPFTCLATTNVLDQTLTDQATLHVFVQVAATIEIAPVDVTVISPESAVFNCIAFGLTLPFIRWEMNGEILEPSRNIQINFTDIGFDRFNSTLYVSNTLPNNTGNYTCVTENPAGTDRASALLTVNYAPEITDPAEEGTIVTVNEGTTAVFECTANGIPGPTITWRRGNGSSSVLTEDPRISLGLPTDPQPFTTSDGVTVFSVSRRLNISETRDNDSALYFCEASSGEEDELNVEVGFQLFVRVAPVITAAPEDRIALREETTVFTCNVTGNPQPNVTWWRNNSTDSDSLRQLTTGDAEGRIDIVESTSLERERETTSTLTIILSLPQDSGVYFCRAENDAGLAVANATLRIHVVPVILFPSNNTVYERVQFTETVVTCNASGIPPSLIQFYRNGSLLESTDDRISILDSVINNDTGDLIPVVTRRFRINPTLDEDSNNYSCTASNINGSDLVQFELVVFVLPEIVSGPESQIVVENDRVVLECVARGRPPPTITWLRGSGEVSKGDGVSIETVQRGAREVSSNVTIQSAQPRDAGNYTCRASNTAGSTTDSADLIVHVPARIDSLVPSPRLIVNESDTAMFRCNATGIPAPVITWSTRNQTFDDVVSSGDLMMTLDPSDLLLKINITQTESYEYLTQGGPVMAVTSVLAIYLTFGNDSDDYKCIATNKIGVEMTEVQNVTSSELYVQVRPVVVAITPDVIGIERENATLQFRIDRAEPEIELSGLRWFYSGDLSMDPMEDITNRSSRINGSLISTSFSSDRLFFNITIVGIVQRRREGEETDEGRYILQATNPAGSSTNFVDLEVYGPPLIIDPPDDQFVRAGNSAIFSCGTLAYPTHYTQWTFINTYGEETPIISTNDANSSKYQINVNLNLSQNLFGRLVVDDVEYVDRGRYRCTAINEVGSRNTSASLSVHVPPVIVSTSSETDVIIEEEEVLLLCQVSGFPHPYITWLYDNVTTVEEEDDSDRIRILRFEGSAEERRGGGSGSGGEGSGSSSGDSSRSGSSGSGSSGSGSSGSGSSGSGYINDQIRDAIFNETGDLEELEVVSVLLFESLERGDTGNYTCTAMNSLPGGQTGTLVIASLPIPFTVLEVPDAATGFTSTQNGSRWVVLEWNFGFDGNSQITSILILIGRDQNVTTFETRVTSQDMNSYNLTEDIVPFTTYEFQLAVCNSIGCGSYSNNVTITTQEDVPEAAPTISAAFSPSSTSLELTWTPPSSDQRNGVLRDYSIYYTDDPDLMEEMDAQQMANTLGDGITLTGLKIFTLYYVSVAASTVPGIGPYTTVSIMTLNDTCSEPLAVMATDVGETNISLSWTESRTPNGIISGYIVMYEVEGSNSGSSPQKTMSNTESVQLVELEPYTTYTVTVTCVNGAGQGNTSSPLAQRTDSAPPQVPDNAIVENLEQGNGRQFVVVFNKPDDTNGPISHYQAVAVKVPDGVSLNQPDTDFNSFSSIDNIYSTTCETLQQSSAYIAAEFGSDGFQGDSLQFTFGDEEDAVNDRSRYSNGLLCYSTNYAFFLRVYNDVDGNVKRSVRQASDRQYDRFSSSGYITYNTESEPSDGGDAGTIAGVVVVIIILVVAAVVIVTVIVVVIKKKRRTVYKTQATESADFDMSFYANEHIQLTEYNNPEDADQQPIPIGQFPLYVEQRHLHENCGFGEQYKVLQDKSPKHDVEVCINQENRQRNRYANIQCFDQSRCVLKPVEGQEHDYINANFINGYNRCNEYIATQGPLPNTVGDFWRLVWDHNVYSIVMLTNLTEKMKVKCSQYWPGEETQTYAGIKVTVKTSTSNADFVVRTFEIQRGEGEEEEVRQVHQFHYVSWPDFGVPRHATPVLHFLRRIRDSHIYSNPRPLLIHCSAGVGRTGTLISIDVELQRAQKEGVVDPYNYVLKMRDQRNHMVQTEAQYVFIHDAILEGTTSGHTEVPVEGLFSRMKELELMDKEGESGYQAEFTRLRQFRVNIKEFTDANDNANQLKNRLANALPYNDNRVYLMTIPGVSGSDYINASYIDGYSRKGTFIATQGPLPETVNDFWRMVAEKEVHVIVMLTQLEEKGKGMCARYWPAESSVTQTRGNVSIELLSEESYQDYIHRKIKLNEAVKGSQVSRVVHHFQFTAWPENGAPEEGAGMIDLIGQVLKVQQQTGDKPLIVHCSAGIGRTGAFCALSTAIERVKAEGLIDVFHTVKHLRTQRPHMVQTLEQYIFCYRAIREYVTSLDEYSNFA